MYPEMLLLAERLVVAMETISQDVKNLSAYVYDMSCSVSDLLNEKREKECTSVAACDEGEHCSFVTSDQYEQADERLSSYTGDPEHQETSFGYIAATSNDPSENTDALSVESTPIFTGGIKIEEQAEVEVHDESSDVTILKEMKSETQWETEGEDQAYDLHTTISHSMGQLTPSGLLEMTQPASSHVWQNIQRAVTSSNSSLNSAGTALVSRLPEAETSVARTHQMESAEDTPVVHSRHHFEEGSYNCSFCGKSFKWRSELERHMSVHSRKRPHKCNVCEKAFANKAVLRQHMRTHTGEKPYKCNVCGKAFRQRHHLTDHMRIHTGEKPFRCTLCGKAFRHSNKLNQHMHMHSYPN